MVNSRYFSQPFDLTNSFGCFWDDIYTEIIGFESMLLCFSAHAKCENKTLPTHKFLFFLPLPYLQLAFAIVCKLFHPTSVCIIVFHRKSARSKCETWKISVAHRIARYIDKIAFDKIDYGFHSGGTMWKEMFALVTTTMSVAEYAICTVFAHRTIQCLVFILAWYDGCAALMQTWPQRHHPFLVGC